ncbi:polymorphic toxin type 35 domain-containing protein [Thermoanaerobacterium thermosaccharolyticum]|uniref:polymorphic toxin type 35 domain-containing protein n=1 Tax=Thermoanaerobacterium thermosaccharolyticum TaxID=1517 RepID=UPI002FDA93C4
MKNLTRKIVSFILMILMVSNIGISAFASENESSSKNANIDKCNIVITDDGVYINDVYYTQEQFVKLLDTAVVVDKTELKDDTIKNNSAMRSVGVQSATGALIAGTWWIPGVGEVVITAAGVVIIGGTVIAAGTWLYKKVVDWFEARAEEKIIDKALKDLDGQPNKQRHIKDPKHNWDKIIKGAITWEKVRNTIEKVMKEGTESRYGSAYKRVLKVGKETVTVTFQKVSDNIWKISDAWVNKE